MSTFESIVLGALLHDIGKFMQRAQKDARSRTHSKWGEQWFEESLAEKLTVFNESEKQTIRSAIGNHHFAEKYISLADAISAGMDRIELDEEETGDPFTDRLKSIFSEISITEQTKVDKYHKMLHLYKENLHEVFPFDEKHCSYSDYEELLDAFTKEITSIEFASLSPINVVNVFYYLLWKYCWCVPSATYKSEPDISLFDHLSTTAAIAGCLYAYQKENVAEILNINTRAFILIGGDISGIQSYIFDVLTQQGKVAKRLRARSLYIQMFSEMAAHKILNTFKLPMCNVINSAGGNFYVLAPNSKDMTEKIEDLQLVFDEWTLNRLNAEVAISIESVELSGKDLGEFSDALKSLKEKMNYKKYQSHKSILTSNNGWFVDRFLRPEVIEGDDKACQGCRKNPIEKPNADNLCDRCSDDIKIGTLLHKTRYIAFFNNASSGFNVFDYSFDLWNKLNHKSAIKPYLILALNSSDIQPPSIGFKSLVTHIPTKADIPESVTGEDIPVTFDDIAGKSEGDKLLGYVKSDVDDMGRILREGFSRAGFKLTISRFAAFSRMLETFFAGYIHKQLKNKFKEVYTIFSGGDDFFIAGPWNKSIDFANSLRVDFSEYCAGNPDMKISTGIILAKHHEPLSFCAELAERTLETSKQQDGKDTITLFGQPLSWNVLDRKVLQEANRLIEWLEAKPPILSRGMAHNLRSYGDMSRKYEETRDTKFLKFVPLLNYDINRNLSKDEQKEAYYWTLNLRNKKKKRTEENNLPYLKTIMEYVLTYTRS